MAGDPAASKTASKGRYVERAAISATVGPSRLAKDKLHKDKEIKELKDRIAN